MEPLTQGLLGAAVAAVGPSRRLGRRALGWGALIGVLPDLDVIASGVWNGFGELVFHRGSTHALWFGPVVGPPLAWLLWRWRDGDPRRLHAWIWLAVLALFTHPLLDVFTTYGTQLLAPFDRTRFAWNGVGIVDPFYTGILAAGVFGAWRRMRAGAPRARPALPAALALALTCAYLALGVGINVRAERTTRDLLQQDGLAVESVRAYPTILQPLLRRIVARTPHAIAVGHWTPLAPSIFPYEAFADEAADPRIATVRATWEGRTFDWFALGQTYAHLTHDASGYEVWIEDLRYALPDRPDRGMWGVRAAFAPDGSPRGPVRRFARRRMADASRALATMWSASLGEPSALERLRGRPTRRR